MSVIAIKEAEVRRVPVKDMKMAAYNPRKDLKPGDKEYEDLKRSMQTFGYVEQIVWNERTGNVVGGHQRLKVLKEAGVTEVGVSVVDLDKNSEKALNIALNKIKGAWDDDKLADLLQGLKAEDYDLGLTGFDDEELDGLLGISAGEVTEDEVPEPPAEPVSKRGEIYELGAHRLMCGDSTSKADVAALIGGGRQADMIWTDPPYGVSYEGKTKDKLIIKNDDIGEKELEALLTEGLGNSLNNSRAGATIYVAAPPGPLMYIFTKAVRSLGVYRQALVWLKNTMVLGHGDYHYKHEMIFYGWKEGKHKTPPTRDQTSVIEADKPLVSAEHPTMKPVALVAKCIENSSAPGGLILDPFGGSGTTLIAAEQLGRTCYMMELDPRYVDVIIQRWETLTGGKAELIENIGGEPQ